MRDPGLVANARMYCVEPASAAAWRTLLQWVGTHARVPLRYIDHPAPAALSSLWRRSDVGCALMCGYPWATWNRARGPRPVPLAVPVPSAAESCGRPVYRTAIVARADGAITSLDDVRGRRFAYTTPDSQSGYQAVRTLFADQVRHADENLFEAVVGPLVTPRRVVDAILGDDADAGPLDSYWLDLLRLHEPATAARLRVIATTQWTAMPMFVASALVDAALHDALGRALIAAGSAPELASLRGTLALSRIASPELGSYAALSERARAADALGYATLR
jgi:ABC-type phosphate/phosphonate transport system substrate-binding protein